MKVDTCDLYYNWFNMYSSKHVPYKYVLFFRCHLLRKISGFPCKRGTFLHGITFSLRALFHYQALRVCDTNIYTTVLTEVICSHIILLFLQTASLLDDIHKLKDESFLLIHGTADGQCFTAAEIHLIYIIYVSPVRVNID